MLPVDDRPVIENERMTALAGMILLGLMMVELVAAANLHALLSVHVYVGVLLAGPLVVKLGSTGYRFLSYYTGTSAFVHRGPPSLPLRILAPLLVAMTLLVLGSGIGLLVTGPALAGSLLPIHNISALVLLPIIVIHIVAHIRRAPRLVANDWRKQSAEQVPGRGRRLGVNLGALMLGAIAALLLLPAAAPWFTWVETSQAIPAPLIVGTVIAILLLFATRPLRWR